jgi:heat shock protein HtpX
MASETIMRLFNGRPADPKLHAPILNIVRQLATRAGLQTMPRVYIIPSETLNAFAIGSRSNALIGITEGIMRQLTLRELAGVIGHEITHVRYNDIWVMSLADVLSRLTRFMSMFAVFVFFFSLPGALFGGQAIPWIPISILYFAPTLSSLLQLALSRSREYDADIGGAELTGDPAALASALNKLERYQGRMWEDIVMPNRRIPIPSVLRTHPATERRVERLLKLRKPAAPPLAIPEVPAPQLGIDLFRPRFHWSGFWY